MRNVYNKEHLFSISDQNAAENLNFTLFCVWRLVSFLQLFTAEQPTSISHKNGGYYCLAKKCFMKSGKF